MSTTKLYVISNPHDDIYGEQHKGTETAVAVSASLNRCYTSFFQALTASTGQQLTTGEKCQIMDGLQPIKLRRRQYFLQEGDVCRRILSNFSLPDHPGTESELQSASGKYTVSQRY